jgi:hypothetical protein
MNVANNSNPPNLELAELTRREALELTEKIKATAATLWRLLEEAHRREAWRALGYPSWTAYIHTEFQMSRSRSYQLLDQATVITAIETAAGEVSTMVDISERDARDLKPVLTAVTNEIRERVERGDDPDDVVRDAIDRVRQKRPAANSREGQRLNARGQVLAELEMYATRTVMILANWTDADHAELEQLIASIAPAIRGLQAIKRAAEKMLPGDRP